MSKVNITLGERIESCRFDIANQANGAVLYECGGTSIIATVCVGNTPIEADFVPLSVQYIQKTYAVGKFPAGFIKREGKPSEFEILTSRLIDRTLRPLFPKGFAYPTHIVAMVVSYDGINDLALCALKAASIALYTSNIIIEGQEKSPLSAVRIGRINGEFIINPDSHALKESELDLFVSGKGDELLMIEMNAQQQNDKPNLLSENLTIEALELAQKHIANDCEEYKKLLKSHQKQPAIPFSLKIKQTHSLEFLRQHCVDSIKLAIQQASKSERAGAFDEIIKEVIAQGFEEEDVKHCLGIFKKSLVREMILQDSVRADGRALDEVRKISIETNILPHAHGSALFTRGQTQALVACTLGTESDAQGIEPLGSVGAKDKFLFHYNFPSFSVGETDMIGSVGRRELGHGNLAKKALKSSIVQNNAIIRIVSEILESNGSSSMASVCGGSLALQASNVAMHSLIAGVAMGLVSEGEKYAILSDITGLEDHDGDMDFKVAGDENGISALQMDIKLGGISSEILNAALMQAKAARVHILGIMKQSLRNLTINYDILPKTENFCVPSNKMVDIIGQGGKTIKGIIEKFEVSIDLDRENGEVTISAQNAKNLKDAKEYILGLVKGFESYEVGLKFKGVVKKICDFGVFIELPNGGDGLLHISKLTDEKGKKPSDILGDTKEIECVIIEINGQKVGLGLA